MTATQDETCRITLNTINKVNLTDIVYKSNIFSYKKAVLSQRCPCDAQSDNTHTV